MTERADGGRVARGAFPFPLLGGPDESRYLTWLRNHSNYMAVRGLPDYLRMVAVLARGILINGLVVILPALLVLALALSVVYGGLLTDWDDQRDPAKTRGDREASQMKHGASAVVHADLEDGIIAIFGKLVFEEESAEEKAALGRYEARMQRVAEERRARPPGWFITKPVAFDSGWTRWAQDKLGLAPPFLITPWLVALAAVWVLVYPIAMTLGRISGYRKSLASGSDSSVRSRDLFERSFGAALLLIIAVALFESLPRIVYLYNQLRIRHFDAGSLAWKEYLALAATGLIALGSAPKLLSLVGGVMRKLLMAAIALVGVLAPLLVVVVVSDFLLFESIALTHDNLVKLSMLLVFAPCVFAVVIACAMVIGYLNETFTAREYRRLGILFIGTIVGHVLLIAFIFVVYVLVFRLYQVHPAAVPDILLAVEELRGNSLETYGDLAAYFVLAIALELWFFGWLTVDVNQTSIHALYRDRLASAFLVGLNARGQVDIEEDIPLGELSCHATGSVAPYHLINVTLNLQGSGDLNLRDRQSDFFIFSKKFIGGERTGYCRSASMEQVFPQIDLASAMAISAAAASPNMGRATSPALVAFMTLMNARLGVWIPNPGLLEDYIAGRKALRTGRDDLDDHTPGLSFEKVFADELVSIARRWNLLYAPALPLSALK